MESRQLLAACYSDRTVLGTGSWRTQLQYRISLTVDSNANLRPVIHQLASLVVAPVPIATAASSPARLPPLAC